MTVRAQSLKELKRELERRTRELRESEARFRDVIERNADAIVVIDVDGSVCFANDSATRLFGRSTKALVGAAFGFPATGGETTELDLIANGTPRVAEMRVVESQWDGHRAYIATLRDVTDRKQAERAERRLIREQAARAAAEEVADQLQIANQTKADFLAVLSHDLRTPLTAILGYTDLMAEGIPHQLSPETLQHVERVRAAARHLLYLLNELLSFARLDAGHDEVRLQEVDLCNVAREVSAIAESLAAQRGLSYSLELPTQALRARTDPDKLRQVLLNVAGNAVKYTAQGEVRMQLRPESGRAIVRVRDTGMGIHPEHLDRIFDPFWQADPGQRTRGGGTGLGLSIVRRLVDLLGAEASVESAVGRGTTFTVALPNG